MYRELDYAFILREYEIGPDHAQVRGELASLFRMARSFHDSNGLRMKQRQYFELHNTITFRLATQSPGTQGMAGT